jgi:hypothetical protein
VRLEDNHVGTTVEKQVQRLSIHVGLHLNTDETRLKGPSPGGDGHHADAIAGEFLENRSILVEPDEVVAVVDQVVGVEEYVLTEDTAYSRVEGLELGQRLDEDGQRAGVDGTQREALDEDSAGVHGVFPTGKPGAVRCGEMERGRQLRVDLG